jgi:hypothetical protein
VPAGLAVRSLPQWLALALDPTRLLLAQRLTPDPWQRDLLFSTAPQLLLNCCRGAGKSRVVSALALHTALFEPDGLVLLVSRSLRQSQELFRYVKQGYRALRHPLGALRETATQLELVNGSRVVSLPGREETIRSFQGVNLLILDEAARIPDELYASVSPMTGVRRGRTVCLSTPFGPRGFFWREWHDAGAPWQRFRVSWRECPRLTAEFIAEERRKFGDRWVAQEYETSFESLVGLVYPDFADCVTDDGKGVEGRKVGGIDFGFRNPFAAVWGVLDRDDVLHLTGERYQSKTPLHEHARALPPGYEWYADPAGRTEIEELRAAGHKVIAGQNDIRLGIAAVTARLRTGRLRVSRRGCPQLIAEAQRYRYPDDAAAEHSENPVDADNHALAALRYLISRVDAQFLARLRQQDRGAEAPDRREWNRLDNPAIWNTLT